MTLKIDSLLIRILPYYQAKPSISYTKHDAANEECYKWVWRVERIAKNSWNLLYRHSDAIFPASALKYNEILMP